MNDLPSFTDKTEGKTVTKNKGFIVILKNKMSATLKLSKIEFNFLNNT